MGTALFESQDIDVSQQQLLEVLGQKSAKHSVSIDDSKKWQEFLRNKKLQLIDIW